MRLPRTAVIIASTVAIAVVVWFIFSGDTATQHIDPTTGRLVGEIKPAEPSKTPSDRDEGLKIALAQIDAEIKDPETRDILRQHAIGRIKGYGQSQPMD
ncbi:MAG: hypothetical protein RL309_1278, partial [Verrucomicrobiota bacterium]